MNSLPCGLSSSPADPCPNQLPARMAVGVGRVQSSSTGSHNRRHDPVGSNDAGHTTGHSRLQQGLRTMISVDNENRKVPSRPFDHERFPVHPFAALHILQLLAQGGVNQAVFRSFQVAGAISQWERSAEFRSFPGTAGSTCPIHQGTCLPLSIAGIWPGGSGIAFGGRCHGVPSLPFTLPTTEFPVQWPCQQFPGACCSSRYHSPGLVPQGNMTCSTYAFLWHSRRYQASIDLNSRLSISSSM